MADGLPIMTSMVDCGLDRAHPLGAIADRTIFSLGDASTSATLR
jgi:hypothetical protein